MNNQKNTRDLVIVKVGTNTLIDHQQQCLDDKTFNSIGEQVLTLAKNGTHVIIVTSGAITAGALHESMDRNNIADTIELQRYAARGWDIVVQKWKSVLGDGRVSSALLTKRELHSEMMRSKLIDVIGCCFAHGDVMVVNENDVLSDDEIKFGDNDTLAAELATALKQNEDFDSVRLVLLTNRDGLNRVADDDSTVIRYVKNVADVLQYVGDMTDTHSRGGMRSKLIAAQKVTKNGIKMYIANGRKKNILLDTLKGGVGTFFDIISS
jgi:glutamate 5-kinase